MTTYKTGAIGDKRKLLTFFAAKEHENLVLRIADILDLRNDQQDWLLKRISRTLSITLVPDQSGWRKATLLRLFPSGYVVLPFEELLEPMTMDEVMKLQEFCYSYYQVRLGKGEPSRIDPCTKCHGRGKYAGGKCKDCDGDGRTITFLEMSDTERELAKEVVHVE